MKAPRRSAVAAAALAALTALECRSTGTDAPLRPDPTTVSVVDAGVVPADAAPAAAAPTTGTIVAWDDPRAVAALATSCTWTPWTSDDQERETGFSCHGDLPEQSCAYDPCFAPSQSCKPRCADACDTCARACVGLCTSCEATCDDDACRTACARTTASCETSCASVRDRCVTAGCAGGYRACREKVTAAWRASRCAEVCPKVQVCFAGCRSVACSDGCFARYQSACPGELAKMCAMGDVTSLANGGTP